MKTLTRPNPIMHLLPAILLGVSLTSVTFAQDKPAAAATPLARKDSILVTTTAKVEAIDQAKREVTLKDDLGNTQTFIVGPAVKRLNQVKVGDLVTADYYVSIAAELREPTAAEREKPLQILEGAGRAPTTSDPAVGGGRQIKAVCTVEGLDRQTETVKIKGPLGRYLTVRVVDPSRLEKVRIGDTVVATYTEALAVSLEKAAPRHVK
jgi:hypothetical protein